MATRYNFRQKTESPPYLSGMVTIDISSSSKRTWQALRAGCWTGHVYYQEHWLTSEDIDRLLHPIRTAAELAELLQEWNGAFALVWQTPERTFAAVDVARAIPLFWSADADRITLSDRIPTEAELIPAPAAIPALAQAEFTPGHTTLYRGWQQLQAGEVLEITGNLCYLHPYFTHRRPAPFTADTDTLQAQFAALLAAQIDRLIAYAKGREIVIPLSGGYDSRILLALLSQKRYPRLKAFTYGQAGSWEVRNARTIAERLGVNWQFVPYTPELLQTFHTDHWRAYAAYAHRGCAIPQEQDFFALHALREQGQLTEDSIICPGYCGDFQAGSYLPATGLPLPWRRTRALQDFLFHRFVRYPDAAVRRQWQAHLPQANIPDRATYISEMEHWVLREYVSKFIINGVRAYEWFDCDWYLPLWDLAFLRFWQRVPNTERLGMRLYRRTMEEGWFKPLNIIFAEDRLAPPLLPAPADYLPAAWKARLKRLRRPAATTDINGLHQLVPMIQQSLNWPQKDPTKSVNEMIGHWLHNVLREE